MYRCISTTFDFGVSSVSVDNEPRPSYCLHPRPFMCSMTVYSIQTSDSSPYFNSTFNDASQSPIIISSVSSNNFWQASTSTIRKEIRTNSDNYLIYYAQLKEDISTPAYCDRFVQGLVGKSELRCDGISLIFSAALICASKNH